MSNGTKRVLMLVPDLMFASRIMPTLEGLGYGVESAADGAALARRASESPPALILIDLAARGTDVAATIGTLKGEAATRDIPVVAFGPHLDQAARQAAEAAGADAVVANSKLALDLPSLVARHARVPRAEIDAAQH